MVSNMQRINYFVFSYLDSNTLQVLVFVMCSCTLCYFDLFWLFFGLFYIFLHFSQSIMGLYILHHKLKWTSRFQAVEIHLLMIIDWTPKKFNNLHLQSLGIDIWKEVSFILENWQEMARAYETTWCIKT